MQSHINVGTGLDLTIFELAEMIAEVTNFSGKLVWDTSKPDGTSRKLLDVSLLRRLGWGHSISLRDGIMETYKWYLGHYAEICCD
jgi:nucleoside-diphosphate-sugar epimerase